jgi:hypothetical protein
MLALEEARMIEPGKKEDVFTLGLITFADSHFERQHMEEGRYLWWVCVPKTPSAFAIDAASKRTTGGEFSGDATEAPYEGSFSYSGRLFSSKKPPAIAFGGQRICASGVVGALLASAVGCLSGGGWYRICCNFM